MGSQSRGKTPEGPHPIRGEHAPQITLVITRELIESGIPRDSGHCVIADAVAAAVPNAKYISVDLQTIRFSNTVKERRYTYLTPRRGQEHLVAFDQGGADALEPFTLVLRGGAVTATARGKSLGEKHLAGVSKGTSDGKRSGPGSVPTTNGGRTPPIAALSHPPKKGVGASAGRRREFGIRALSR